MSLDSLSTTGISPRPATRWRSIPWSLLLGPALIACWWTIAWWQIRPVSDYSFFPLWLGYILTVDGLLRVRTGSSPITRAGWRVVLMFAVSIGMWWVFEAYNRAIQNWHYMTPRHYGPLAYGALASVAFSTVIPAVLSTAELVGSFGANPLRRLPPLRQTRGFLLAAHLLGWVMLAAVALAPSVAFPFVWLSLIFLLDPLLTWIGGRSIGSYLDRGDWTIVFNLCVAGLICGWFWEMWNFYSLPKWRYTVPHFGFLHVFEMPLLGYGGYLPFGVEVYVFYMLVAHLLRWRAFPEPRVAGVEAANVRGTMQIESPQPARL